MIRLRTREETARHKCYSCRHARVTSMRDGRVETICGVMCDATRIAGEVTACTSYDFQYAHSDSRDDAIAWVLEFKKGRPIGFRPPKD